MPELETPQPAATLSDLPRLTKVPGGEPDLDATVAEAEAGAQSYGASIGDPALPLKVRIVPTLYIYDSPKYEGYEYRTWRGVSWILEATPAQVKQLRVDLDAFMRSWVETTRAGGAA